MNQVGVPIASKITPETVRSSDIAWTFARESWYVVANLYRIDLPNGIASQEGVFANVDKISRTGAELEIQHQSDSWRVYWGVSSRIKAEDSDGRYFDSRILSKLGLSYLFPLQSVGLSFRSASARENVGSYSWLNVNYHYSFKALTLYTTVGNLLDERIHFPDVRSRADFSMQGVNRRKFSLGAKWSF